MDFIINYLCLNYGGDINVTYYVNYILSAKKMKM